jgi:hypothetical protein
MRSKAELDAAMAQAGFKPDHATGGYRNKHHQFGDLWVSSVQARAALAAAKKDKSWTEDDIEPLSETLARSLTLARIGGWPSSAR